MIFLKKNKFSKRQIGVDITTISRFENCELNFIKRFCSPEEVAELEKQVDKATYLASLWAIKEALFKANNSLSNFNKITIQKIDKKWTYKNYAISTSHEGDLLIAFVSN
ncbi:4'-phosphopantetheinyl transferase superfamily protein [Mycoplasmopsis mucosicanis]|uniref:4'-phosphopantetheinyl transferase superfamily protein n=1 Tax=Mycoplasmopsis mucosicanis TaxID=458208 RepID=A0A507SXS7_9BACT|nr:4'-phosphopantetheinyl transferase superfamily protein [Mycoplasmopsis mucosicanis]TQC54043.1 4'-phosphopantetheinyl transferase superfamily protein [Mycoplasmopsis mucosicanis]